MAITPPELRWNPGTIGKSEEALEAKGQIQGSPFATRDEAFAAVRDLRHRAHETSVFLVTKLPDSKYAAFEYGESHWIDDAQLDELRTRGLPLGGNARAPETYLIDADGHVGRLTPGARQPKPEEPRADDSFTLEPLRDAQKRVMDLDRPEYRALRPGAGVGGFKLRG